MRVPLTTLGLTGPNLPATWADQCMHGTWMTLALESLRQHVPRCVCIWMHTLRHHTMSHAKLLSCSCISALKLCPSMPSTDTQGRVSQAKPVGSENVALPACPTLRHPLISCWSALLTLLPAACPNLQIALQKLKHSLHRRLGGRCWTCQKWRTSSSKRGIGEEPPSQGARPMEGTLWR